ncbi:MAG: hypothetical protein AAGJ34_06995 [Pseudomonadota bacterium]
MNFWEQFWTEVVKTPTLFTGTVAFLIFALTQAGNMYSAWLRRRKRAISLMRALYAEVEFNTQDLRKFTEHKDQRLKIVEKRLRADPDRVPHVTDAQHTIVYRENIDYLGAIKNLDPAPLVCFYGELEKMNEMIRGLSRPTYKALPKHGKVNVIKRLYDSATETERLGQIILNDMQKIMPKNISRKAPPAPIRH